MIKSGEKNQDGKAEEAKEKLVKLKMPHLKRGLEFLPLKDMHEMFKDDD